MGFCFFMIFSDINKNQNVTRQTFIKQLINFVKYSEIQGPLEKWSCRRILIAELVGVAVRSRLRYVVTTNVHNEMLIGWRSGHR